MLNRFISAKSRGSAPPSFTIVHGGEGLAYRRTKEEEENIAACLAIAGPSPLAGKVGASKPKVKMSNLTVLPQFHENFRQAFSRSTELMNVAHSFYQAGETSLRQFEKGSGNVSTSLPASPLEYLASLHAADARDRFKALNAVLDNDRLAGRYKDCAKISQDVRFYYEQVARAAAAVESFNEHGPRGEVDEEELLRLAGDACVALAVLSSLLHDPSIPCPVVVFLGLQSHAKTTLCDILLESLMGYAAVQRATRQPVFTIVERREPADFELERMRLAGVRGVATDAQGNTYRVFTAVGPSLDDLQPIEADQLPAKIRMHMEEIERTCGMREDRLYVKKVSARVPYSTAVIDIPGLMVRDAAMTDQEAKVLDREYQAVRQMILDVWSDVGDAATFVVAQRRDRCKPQGTEKLFLTEPEFRDLLALPRPGVTLTPDQERRLHQTVLVWTFNDFGFEVNEGFSTSEIAAGARAATSLGACTEPSEKWTQAEHEYAVHCRAGPKGSDGICANVAQELVATLETSVDEQMGYAQLARNGQLFYCAAPTHHRLADSQRSDHPLCVSDREAILPIVLADVASTMANCFRSALAEHGQREFSEAQARNPQAWAILLNLLETGHFEVRTLVRSIRQKGLNGLPKAKRTLDQRLDCLKDMFDAQHEKAQRDQASLLQSDPVSFLSELSVAVPVVFTTLWNRIRNGGPDFVYGILALHREECPEGMYSFPNGSTFAAFCSPGTPQRPLVWHGARAGIAYAPVSIIPSVDMSSAHAAETPAVTSSTRPSTSSTIRSATSMQGPLPVGSGFSSAPPLTPHSSVGSTLPQTNLHDRNLHAFLLDSNWPKQWDMQAKMATDAGMKGIEERMSFSCTMREQMRVLLDEMLLTFMSSSPTVTNLADFLSSICRISGAEDAAGDGIVMVDNSLMQHAVDSMNRYVQQFIQYFASRMQVFFLRWSWVMVQAMRSEDVVLKGNTCSMLDSEDSAVAVGMQLYRAFDEWLQAECRGTLTELLRSSISYSIQMMQGSAAKKSIVEQFKECWDRSIRPNQPAATDSLMHDLSKAFAVTYQETFERRFSRLAESTRYLLQAMELNDVTLYNQTAAAVFSFKVSCLQLHMFNVLSDRFHGMLASAEWQSQQRTVIDSEGLMDNRLSNIVTHMLFHEMTLRPYRSPSCHVRAATQPHTPDRAQWEVADVHGRDLLQKQVTFYRLPDSEADCRRKEAVVQVMKHMSRALCRLRKSEP